MDGYQKISTETWQILIPSEWADPERNSSGSLYFESPNESKGVYVTTWNCQPEDYQSQNRKAIDHFRKVELNAFNDMPESSWCVLNDGISEIENRCITIIDCFDEGNCYRIISKIVASLPWVVRLSFHDYFVEDYGISKDFTDPVIESLQIHQ